MLLHLEISTSISQAPGSFMASSLETLIDRSSWGLFITLQRQSTSLVAISFKGTQQEGGGLFGDFKNGWQGSSFCMHFASCTTAACPRPGRSCSRLTPPELLWERQRWTEEMMRRNERRALEAMMIFFSREKKIWTTKNQRMKKGFGFFFSSSIPLVPLCGGS